MSNPVQAQRIRIALDSSSPAGGRLQGSQTDPVLWKGFDADIELGFFLKSEVADISSLAAIYLELKESVTSAALLTKSITNFSNALTSTSWQDQSAQHAKFSLTAAELNRDLGEGQESKAFYAIVYAVTTGPSSKNIPLGFFKPTLKLFGASIAGEPPDVVPLAVTAEQVMQLMLMKVIFPEGVNAVRFNLDGTFELLEIT